MNLRFKVGDLAIFARRRVPSELPLGAEVVICEVGPIAAGRILPGRSEGLRLSADYVFAMDGEFFAGRDWQLRKKRPPIPPEVLETFKEREVTA